MEPSGFFTIHVGDPEQGHAPEIEAPASKGEAVEAGIAGSGHSVRIDWMKGVPHLTDLGSVSKILVNSSPIAPNRPVAIQAGDSITIGNTHLTWHPGTEAEEPIQEPTEAQLPKVTVVLPREDAADETLLAPKQMTEQIRHETPDPTLLAPKKVARPPTPEEPDSTILVPKVPSGSPNVETPDPTLIVPKSPARPRTPLAPDAKALAPEEAAEMPFDQAMYKTAWVDMTQHLEEDTGLEFESTTILRDTKVPHLVLHTPNRTWEVQLTKEVMAIGRGEGNDIPVPDESVSLHHALIECRDDGYLIRDDRSTNGVWLGKQRVDEHKLRNGDALSLGRAKLVFKGGFTSDDLTLIGTPRIDGRATRRPVVFVPGLMGTELWIGSERLWPDIKLIISNPELFRLPGDPRIEPRGIVNDVVIVPHIIQQRQYSAMGDYLVAGLGYTRGRDLIEFGYDWRHDVRLSAQRLAETIESWQVNAPITIIAHSLGTMVTRYYVERLGGKRFVERIILMGGPHYGAPKIIAGILHGPGILPFGMGDERMRAVLGTFPSSYQILPTYPCVFDQDGNHIDILEDESWLPEQQRPYLSAARSFRRELGTVSSVPAVSIFGYGLKTKLRVKIHRRPDGQWQEVEFVEETAGDQSVPSGSAVLKDSEIHPVLQEHGSLYVDDDVRMRLKVELTRSTTWQRS